MKNLGFLSLSGSTWSNRFYIAALIAVVIAGIGFRSAGYFNGTISLWWDEIHWLEKLMSKPITNMSFRPIGYMWLSKMLVGVRLDETFIRLTSYVPSLFSIALIYLISIKVFKSKITVLVALFLFCLNPTFIAFAKEFKPYAMEVFVHLFLVWVTLQYFETRSRAILVSLLSSCFIGLTLAYNIVFLFPTIFLILLWVSYQQNDKRTMFFLLVSSASLIAIIVMTKLTLLSHLNLSQQEVYWGTKYHVFFLGEGVVDKAMWMYRAYLGLVQHPLQAKVFWSFGPDFRSLLIPIIYALHFGGFVAMVLQRNILNALLFVLPIVVILIFNYLGIWPFRVFRTNLFMMSYFAFISLIGLDFALTSRFKPLKITAAVTAAFLVLAQLPLDFTYHNIKRSESLSYHSEMRSVLDYIYRYETEALSVSPELEDNYKGTILVDAHSFPQIIFYMTKHPDTSPILFPLLSKYKFGELAPGNDFEILRLNLYRVLGFSNPGDRVWIIISKHKWFDEVSAMPLIRENLQLEKNFHGGNLLLLWVVGEPKIE